MSDVIIRKEVSALPQTLTPDTLYFVRVGDGFDLYLTDSSGVVAQGLNASPGIVATGDTGGIALSGTGAADDPLLAALKVSAVPSNGLMVLGSEYGASAGVYVGTGPTLLDGYDRNIPLSEEGNAFGIVFDTSTLTANRARTLTKSSVPLMLQYTRPAGNNPYTLDFTVEDSTAPPIPIRDGEHIAGVWDGVDFHLAYRLDLKTGKLATDTFPVATPADFASAASGKVLAAESVWGVLAPLADAATITVDLDAGYDFGGAGDAPLALGGNRTLGAPSHPRTGKKGVLWFTATATRTLTLHADWRLATGVEVGPYEIVAGNLLGIAYACVGATVIVTGIIRVEA